MHDTLNGFPFLCILRKCVKFSQGNLKMCTSEIFFFSDYVWGKMLCMCVYVCVYICSDIFTLPRQKLPKNQLQIAFSLTARK